MLGKLLKYEFQATARTFIPMYIMMLLISLTYGILSGDSFQFLSTLNNIVLIIFVGIFVALMVTTLIVLIQRFNTNLLGDEGYLMFTLPISPKYLIFSKLVSMIVWYFISFIVGIVSIGLLMSRIIPFGEYMYSFIMPIYYIGESLGISLTSISIVIKIIQLIFNTILILMTNILLIYLSITIGKTFFTKYVGIISFVIYLVLNNVIGYIYGSQTLNYVFDVANSLSNEYEFYNFLSTGLNIVTIVNVILVLVLMEVINLLLTKKLELA
ncbi:MAG: hypothetical protein BEN19_02665 [Epulopiscium sp. Nuni2H_MBin003]|nr:MAG: hypothetical protein BEN19_02665 [Epulopiscium sp. Nuni2H_MBin003]